MQQLLQGKICSDDSRRPLCFDNLYERPLEQGPSEEHQANNLLMAAPVVCLNNKLTSQVQ